MESGGWQKYHSDSTEQQSEFPLLNFCFQSFIICPQNYLYCDHIMTGSVIHFAILMITESPERPQKLSVRRGGGGEGSPKTFTLHESKFVSELQEKSIIPYTPRRSECSCTMQAGSGDIEFTTDISWTTRNSSHVLLACTERADLYSMSGWNSSSISWHWWCKEWEALEAALGLWTECLGLCSTLFWNACIILCGVSSAEDLKGQNTWRGWCKRG